MDSELYEIEVKDGNKTIKEVLEDHEYGLSEAIIKKICYAIDNNIKRIDIARLVANNVCVTIHSSNKNYKDSLETNMGNLIKYEAYELCAMAKKHIDILEKKDLDI
jgi:hypothetical protein